LHEAFAPTANDVAAIDVMHPDTDTVPFQASVRSCAPSGLER
jgi:hypothetical protein